MADAPGTCHLIGCEGKGTVDEHARKPIGCPDTFAPYEDARCLGFPYVLPHQSGEHLTVVCSVNGSLGFDRKANTMDPRLMAELVDQHRADCSNRSPR